MVFVKVMVFCWCLTKNHQKTMPFPTYGFGKVLINFSCGKRCLLNKLLIRFHSPCTRSHMLTSGLPFFAANLSEFARKGPTVVNYCLFFFQNLQSFFHATLQSSYISKSKHLFCNILQGIMVQYVKYSMCENHENTLKFEGTGNTIFQGT